MGLIPDDVISQVIDRCDIVETIAGYIPLKRTGRNLKAACPFHHEKTPSFVVNPEKQIFHCFGCGVGGNVVSFVMKQERMDFPEAIRFLAQKVGVDIPDTSSPGDSQKKNLKQSLYQINDLAVHFYHRFLLSDKSPAAQNARTYLKGRGISLEHVQTFKLGFAPDSWDSLYNFLRSKDVPIHLAEKAGVILANKNKDGFYDRFRNRIIFPIFDVRAHCLGFGARAMEQDATAKYINSPETDIYVKGRHLYGLHLAKDAVVKEDAVIVAEGYMDFIMPFASGVQNMTASLGTALTVDQIRLIRRYTKNVIMLFDADQAGAMAMLRSFDLLIEQGMNVKVASLKAGEDPDSFIREYGVDTFKERIAQSQTLFDYKLSVLLKLHKGDTLESRAQIAKEILPTIQKVDNEIVRSGLIQKLSVELSVSEQALKAELAKVPEEQTWRQQTVSQTKGEQKVYPKAEYGLLKLLLADQSLIPVAQKALILDDLQDVRIKGIIQKLFDVGDGSHLTQSLHDEETLKIVAEVSANEDIDKADHESALNECLSRIKKDRLKIQRQTVMNRIKQAEVNGDLKQLEQLKAEFNEILEKGQEHVR